MGSKEPPGWLEENIFGPFFALVAAAIKWWWYQKWDPSLFFSSPSRQKREQIWRSSWSILSNIFPRFFFWAEPQRLMPIWDRSFKAKCDKDQVSRIRQDWACLPLDRKGPEMGSASYFIAHAVYVAQFDPLNPNCVFLISVIYCGPTEWRFERRRGSSSDRKNTIRHLIQMMAIHEEVPDSPDVEEEAPDFEAEMKGIPNEFKDLYRDEELIQILIDLIHTAADLDILDFQEFCKHLDTPKPMWSKTQATTGKHKPVYWEDGSTTLETTGRNRDISYKIRTRPTNLWRIEVSIASRVFQYWCRSGWLILHENAMAPCLFDQDRRIELRQETNTNGSSRFWPSIEHRCL